MEREGEAEREGEGEVKPEGADGGRRMEKGGDKRSL
jgi:hypothetical protein